MKIKKAMKRIEIIRREKLNKRDRIAIQQQNQNIKQFHPEKPLKTVNV